MHAHTQTYIHTHTRYKYYISTHYFNIQLNTSMFKPVQPINKIKIKKKPTLIYVTVKLRSQSFLISNSFVYIMLTFSTILCLYLMMAVQKHWNMKQVLDNKRYYLKEYSWIWWSSCSFVCIQKKYINSVLKQLSFGQYDKHTRDKSKTLVTSLSPCIKSFLQL